MILNPYLNFDGNTEEAFLFYKMGNNISLSLQPESKEEADRLFQGLSNGGKVTMPIADVFWGAYFGMCDDQFGVHWMINYEYPK